MRPVTDTSSVHDNDPARVQRLRWQGDVDELLYAIEEHNLRRGPDVPLPSCIVSDAVRLGVSRRIAHRGDRMHDALLGLYERRVPPATLAQQAPPGAAAFA